MAKTRLFKDDREAIRAALVGHKYDPIFAAREREEFALAAEVWDHIYAAHKAAMAKLPAGALPESDHITVRAYGKYVTLHFGRGDFLKRPKRRLFDAHKRVWEAPACDLAERVERWAQAGEDLKKERNEMGVKLDAALASFRTFDDLLAAWPDAERFITKRWRERPEYASSQLPAPVLTDLSKALDLPPDVKEAA